ncbi:MAG: hypothetical protein F4180_03290 [Chloroflexi bacterium]|nr:hypothetical protein [Chloroflexota bacterium]
MAVWVSQTDPPSAQYHPAFPDGHYQYKICDSSFPTNTAAWRSDINSGFETWEDNLIWRSFDAMGNVVNITMVSENASGAGNCSTGREFDGNIVKGIAVENTFREKCFGRNDPMMDPWTTEELDAKGCDRADDSGDVRSVFFWKGHTWSLGTPSQGLSCSNLGRTAAHEAAHALGLRPHLTSPGQLMSSTVTVCEPTTSDLMYLMRRYQ